MGPTASTERRAATRCPLAKNALQIVSSRWHRTFSQYSRGQQARPVRSLTRCRVTADEITGFT